MHLRRVPAIVTDIDGVLVRGKNIIPGAPHVLKSVLEGKFLKSNNPFKIPFVCLTNGGGLLEKHKAEQLNNIFKSIKLEP
jgi:ribonucleotide monophosphatase NagD (HAD superfamily)